MLLSHETGSTLPFSVVRLVKLRIHDGCNKLMHNSEVRSLLAKQPTERPKKDNGK
jgi:hypothetical protein